MHGLLTLFIGPSSDTAEKLSITTGTDKTRADELLSFPKAPTAAFLPRSIAMSIPQRQTQYDSYQPGPHPLLSPEEVVLLQLRALKANDERDNGIVLAYRFASPEHQAFTGTYDRFERQIKTSVYAPLLNYLTEELGPARVESNSAVLRTTVLARDRQRYSFTYYLSRQEVGVHAGCWLIDGLSREAAPLPSVSPDAAKRIDRLTLLFTELGKPLPEPQHQLIEEEIWAQWLHHDNADYAELLQVGLRAIGERDYDTAFDAFCTLLHHAPEYPEAWNKRAYVHYLRGDFKRALDDIARALELEPRHFGALQNQATIYLEVGIPEAALRSYERLRRILPFSAALLGRIAELRQRLA